MEEFLMNKSFKAVISCFLICCLMVSTSIIVSAKANSSTVDIPVLLEMQNEASQDGCQTEIPELKNSATWNEYDAAIVDANSRSTAKFVKVIGIEQMMSIEDFKAKLNEEIEKENQVKEYIARSKERKAKFSSQIGVPSITATTTRTYSQTCWSDESFQITATCTSSSRITVSNIGFGRTALGVVRGACIFGDPITYSASYFDSYRTAGVTCYATTGFVNFATGTTELIERRSYYAEFYKD